jgi:SprB repeat
MKFTNILPKVYPVIMMMVIFSFSLTKVQAQTESMSAGSYIINMGVPSQTINNALRPYGMIYDLTKNHQVPIRWVINPNKDKDGVDFTFNGVSYKGGPFIIPAEFRTSAVNARITYWQGQGVVGVTTNAPVTVPVYAVIGSAIRWTLDAEHGDIAIPYLNAASIPSSAYGYKLPSALKECDDLYIMPHAEPTSAKHGNLVPWNDKNRGSIWLGCKAASELDKNVGKFLTVNALILEANHPDLVGGVTYTNHGDPVMQFLGTGAHLASATGAEQIYYPDASGWRPTTRVGIYQTLPNVAANLRKGIIVYGPGFGDPNKGWVCMHAGHELNTSGNNSIPAMRAFHNFSLLAAITRTVYPVLSGVPNQLSAGIGNPLSYTLSPAGGTWTTQWSSSCGGTFSPSATSANATYTPPAGATSCVISVRITDACGRVFFASKVVSVQCVLTATRSVTNVSCNGGNNGSIAMNISGSAGPYSWNWSRVSPAGTGSGSGTTISGLTAGSYNVTVSSPAGCQTTFTELVTQPTIFVATATATNFLCFGQTGSISATTTGGTPPVTYSWSGPGGYTSSSQNPSNLLSGTYTVTVTDSRSCTTTRSASVSGPATAVSVVLDNKTDVSCNGGTNGVINITASGGIAGYTYIWSDASTVQDRIGLSAGAYTVTATDANGCQATLTVTINEPTPITLSIAPTSVSCTGGTNGSILVTATGGTASYNISWSGTASGNPAGTEIAASGGNYNIASLSAGTYQISVTDANGCIATVTQSVTAPAALVATAVAQSYSCFGGTGGVSLTVTGGTFSYTYSWTGPGGYTSTTQNVSSAVPGLYNVTVTDTNLCITTATATVSGPAGALAITLDNITDVSCNGGANGVVNITASGGTPVYTYAWSDGSTMEDRTGLTSDTYTITATDANACQATLSVTITEPTSLTLSIAPTNVSCAGGNNGSIQVTATGGISPYQVSWSGAASGNPAGTEINVSGGNYTISALSAGTYNITVTDANGCTTSATQSVTAPAALTVTALASPFSCFGGTGGISLTVTGGTFPHTYSWSGPGGYTSTAQNISNITLGTYNVTVTDAKSCTRTATATLSGPATAVSINLDNKTNVSCQNGADGIINITAVGGTPGYTYAWSDVSTAQDRTGLSADTYTVTATDANGCTGTRSEVISEPLPLVVSTTQTSVSCAGGSNGSIAVTSTGGVAPYQVAWSGVSSGNPAGVEIATDGGNYTITSLVVGAYIVTVTDANGCTSTLSRTIMEPSALTATTVPTDYLCFGQTGSVDLTVVGGTSSYSYSWTGAGGFTGSIEDVDGVSAGPYSVTVTDANNCTTVATGTLGGPSAAVTVVTTSKTNTSCEGSNNGTIDITATGGSPSYTYLWSDSNTSEDRSGLSPGDYIVTVTDANGCQTSMTETITEPTGLEISFTKTDPTCPPGANPIVNSDGSIDITVVGGTGTYTYAWTTVTGAGLIPANADQSGLTTGTYTVTVTDTNGCTAMISVILVNTLPIPSPPTSID